MTDQPDHRAEPGPALAGGADTGETEARGEKGGSDSLGGGPRRLVIAGTVLALVVVALVVSTRGDSSRGGCISGLADHLGPGMAIVAGGDTRRIEDAGYDVGSADGLVEAATEVAFLPDPITGELLRRSADDAEATAGYTADEVDCWVGDMVGAFVADGDFDAEQVADAELADDLAIDNDLLAYERDGHPDPWLDRSDDTPVSAAIRALDDLGVVSFSGLATAADDQDIQTVDGLVWAGVGVAHPDDWELIAVWAFSDADRAESSVDRVIDAVEQGEVPSMIEGDIADLVERDGAVLTLHAPLREEEISRWRKPLVLFDPMFSALLDLDNAHGPDAD